LPESGAWEPKTIGAHSERFRHERQIPDELPECDRPRHPPALAEPQRREQEPRAEVHRAERVDQREPERDALADVDPGQLGLAYLGKRARPVSIAHGPIRVT